MNKRKRMSMEDILVDSVVYLVLIFLLVIAFYPVWYVIVASFSTGTALAANPGILLWPREISTEAYKLVFENKYIMGGFKNTLMILGLSLPLNIFMTMLCGYFLASTGMMWKKCISWLIIFTMFFGGGMIPSYLNVKQLGLMDSVWALVLPGCMSVYNAIICKTAIETIPESLPESARIDGATDFQILFRIIMPLIKPTLAVLLLYYGVGHWNNWFNASLYIKTDARMPVQNIIRSILMENNSKLNDMSAGYDNYNAYAETIKYAAIVVTTLPIMCIYPFLQKYFTKGVMIGAVKG